MTFSRKFPARTGLTLVEVVAGLALMATVLVAMLLLKTQFIHQLATSNSRLRSAAAADSLLDQWWANPTAFPINRSGTVSDFPGLEWQTHVVPTEVVEHLHARVIRLDIMSEAKIITSVELLLPKERRHSK